MPWQGERLKYCNVLLKPTRFPFACSFATGVWAATSPHAPPLTSHRITPHHVPSRHIGSHRVTSRHVISHHVPLHHIGSHYVTSRHVTAHHVPSHHIASHHITSHRITSHHATSHSITSTFVAPNTCAHHAFGQNADQLPEGVVTGWVPRGMMPAVPAHS